MNLDTSLRTKEVDGEFSGERTITVDHTSVVDSGEQISNGELRLRLRLPVDDSIAGNFSELHAIGMGGMGTVYSALEPGLNREVALKVLRPKYREHSRQIESFIHEAVITAEINHPNIVPVYRLGVFDDAGVFFTMKRLSGETLRKIIRKLGERRGNYLYRYTLRRRMEIFVSICNGIAYAHSKGIIHRDLKPANIMVGDYGEVTIMDWGLARDLHGKKGVFAGEEIPAPGRISGTPSFMAPEQALGQDELIDERSDVYGLGAVLYTLLTLTSAPFDPELETEKLLGHVISGDFLAPRKRAPRENIPRELEAICLKAMARERQDRYESANTLLDDVRNYLENYPVSAYTPNPFYRLFKLCKRRPLIPATLLGAAAMAGAFFTLTHLEEHMRINSLMQIGDSGFLQGNAYYRMAMRAQMDAGRHGEEQREDVRRLTSEMESAYATALDAFQQAESIGKVRFVGKVSRMLRNRLKLLEAQGKFDEVRMAERNMRRRWKLPMQQLALSSPDFMRKVHQIVVGEGECALETTPSGLAFELFAGDAYEAKSQKIVSGKTPWQGKLPVGKYSLVLASPVPGRTMRLPIPIQPGELRNEKIVMSAKFPDEMVYISGGAFNSLLAHEASLSEGRMVYLPGFFIKEKEVSIGEYLKFWNNLRSKEERERFRGKYQFDRTLRRYENMWDDQGRLRAPFREDLPVVGIPGDAAEAYCRYVGKSNGVTCRLPKPQEWEKAARGTDGRRFVWGDQYRSGGTLNAEYARADSRYPVGAPGGRFRFDTSPYGVKDMAGNVREFVARPLRRLGDLYPVMGGSHNMSRAFSAIGYSGYAGDGENDIGFRYVIEVDQK